MPKTRIYLVREMYPEVGDGQHLVRAASAAQAVRHVTESLFTVGVATTEQIVALLTSDAKVEDAKQEGQANEVNGLAPESVW